MSATYTNLNRAISSGWTKGYDSQAFVNSDSLQNSAGTCLLHAMAWNKSSTALYLMFFDAGGVPTNGTAPLFMPLPLTTQNQPLALPLNDYPGSATFTGWTFTTGIIYAVSTTPATLTVDSSNSVWVTLRFAA